MARPGPALSLTAKDALRGAFICVLGLGLGLGAGTGYGAVLVGAFVAAIFGAIAIALYQRDPVLAVIWLWLFVVFNAPVSAAVGYYSSAGEAVRQADELLVLLLLVLTIARALQRSTPLPPMRFVAPGAIFAAFGVLGALFNNVPVIVCLLGLWLGLKLWTMVGITLFLPWKREDIKRVYVAFTRVGLVVAAVGLADYMTHEAVSRALGTSIYEAGHTGYRAEAVHSIFPHPGEYSLFMSMLFAVTFVRFAMTRSRSDLLLAFVFAGSVMLSLRLKGVLSLAVVVVIVMLVQAVMNNRGAITILLVGVLMVIGIYSVDGNVVAKQVATYASSETSARSRLYSTGELIAKEHFPLGVGFGRYGSYPSRLFYSPVYYKYGLNTVYGLAKTGPDFIDDTSWPSVIGEAGYGGFVAYLLGLILVITAIIRALRKAALKDRWVPLATLCVLAVIIVDSLGDPTLFDWLATTTFAMMLGLVLVAIPPGVDRADEQSHHAEGAEHRG
jgi:hypothetical protein